MIYRYLSLLEAGDKYCDKYKPQSFCNIMIWDPNKHKDSRQPFYRDKYFPSYSWYPSHFRALVSFPKSYLDSLVSTSVFTQCSGFAWVSQSRRLCGELPVSPAPEGPSVPFSSGFFLLHPICFCHYTQKYSWFFSPFPSSFLLSSVCHLTAALLSLWLSWPQLHGTFQVLTSPVQVNHI